MSVIPLLAALAIVAPSDGTVVSAQKPLRLAWRGETNAVYLLRIACAGHEPQVFAISNRTDAYVGNLEVCNRFDWSVRAAGSLDSARAHFVTDETLPRQLRADGVREFRDLGGWRTASGSRVRQGRILCSAALRGRVTDSGIATLRSDFGIRTDVDLRSRKGLSSDRGTVLGEDVAWKSIPFCSGRRIDDVVDGRESFASVFALLTDPGRHPVLLEDGDGLARANALGFLLNGLLGVSEENLRANWTASPKELEELIGYLKLLSGETLRARIESYARGCGIADAEIEAFRSLMLEESK